MSDDEKCGCGSDYYYVDDDGVTRCGLCRRIATNHRWSHGRLWRDSDFTGGEIVEFVGWQLKNITGGFEDGKGMFAELCDRCVVEYVHGKGVCWKCKAKEASDDDGC